MLWFPLEPLNGLQQPGGRTCSLKGPAEAHGNEKEEFKARWRQRAAPPGARSQHSLCPAPRPVSGAPPVPGGD